MPFELHVRPPALNTNLLAAQMNCREQTQSAAGHHDWENGASTHLEGDGQPVAVVRVDSLGLLDDNSSDEETATATSESVRSSLYRCAEALHGDHPLVRSDNGTTDVLQTESQISF